MCGEEGRAQLLAESVASLGETHVSTLPPHFGQDGEESLGHLSFTSRSQEREKLKLLPGVTFCVSPETRALCVVAAVCGLRARLEGCEGHAEQLHLDVLAR